MNIYRQFFVGIVIVLVSAVFSGASLADRWKDRVEEEHAKKKIVESQKPGYVLDKRYSHNRYYPKRGYIEQRLPPGHRTVIHRDRRFYFYGGTWYQPYENHYVVVTPPVGVRIAVLPSFYTTLWVGGIPYYYADGIYYMWEPRERVYVVTDPPAESRVVEQENTLDRIFVYPKKGQSEEKQAADRYECHQWAQHQSGFDPTEPGGTVAANEYTDKRAHYYRAMKACLEGREYSVQ